MQGAGLQVLLSGVRVWATAVVQCCGLVHMAGDVLLMLLMSIPYDPLDVTAGTGWLMLTPVLYCIVLQYRCCACVLAGVHSRL
jgi:hypothetical protein